METKPIPDVRLIPIELISVVNPRVRNKKVFHEIVTNIAEIGLKKPITVARRNGADGERYELVCGQGRLEAYQSLGQTEIPALVVDADGEECLVMSLVENLARRQHRAIDLLHDISGMKKRGYREPEIAAKTGLTVEYVRSVMHLLDTGEDRLLRAVDAGTIPVSVAVDIAMADDAGVQRVLQQAYERRLFRGNKILAVKRLIEQRRVRGKGLRLADRRPQRPLSVNSLLRTYRDDADKKKMLVSKAEATRDRLVFVTEGLRTLLQDDNFVTLLRAEGLDTLPRNLNDRLVTGGRA